MGPASPPQSGRSLLGMALIGALGVGLGGAGGLFLSGKRPSFWPPERPTRQDRVTVEALGRLQPAGGVIGIFGPPGDRVEELLVKQGDTVVKDKVLFQLASRKDRKMEEELAKEQLNEARAQKKAIAAAGDARLALIDAELAQASGGREQDVLAQNAGINLIEAKRNAAQAHVERLTGRTKRKALGVSPQELDQAELLLRQAKSELKSAKALLKKTEIAYDQNKKTLEAKRRAAEADVKQALQRVPLCSLQRAYAIARRKTELSEIKAPVAGTVLKINVSKGESTGRGPLLELGGGKGMIAVAEVYETDVRLLREWVGYPPGTVKVEVSGSALTTSLDGTLSKPEQIARLISRNALMSLSPRADVDRRVIEVKVVDLKPPGEIEHLVGLQVNVKFRRPSQP